MTPPAPRSRGDGPPRPDTELIHPPPRGRARCLVSAFIAAWVLGQIAVPASYHVTPNPSEERFAWRMFSDVWWYHKTCQVSLVETLNPPGSTDAPVSRVVALERAFHLVWLRELPRRPVVVDKALRQRCDADPTMREVLFIRTCPAAPPSRLPPVRLKRTCRTGVVEEEAPPAAAGARS